MKGKGHHADRAADPSSRAEEQARQDAARPPAEPVICSLEDSRRMPAEPGADLDELAGQNDALRRAQAELETSRARYLDLYDRAPFGYVTVDEQGVIREANRTAATMLGVDRAALVGQPLAGFVLPEDREVYRGHRKALREPEAAQACEVRMVRGEGAPFWARLDAANVSDEGGVRGCRCVISDITERRQAEEGLRAGARRATAQRQAIVLLLLGKGIDDGTTDQALGSMVEVVSAALDVARCSVWMLSDDRSELRCRELYEAGSHTHRRGQVLAVHDLPHYFAALLGESRIAAADAQNDPRTRELNDSYLVPRGITSMLDAGILVEGRLLGVVCLEHVGPRRRWHADEEAFASTVATLVAEWFLADQRKRAEEALRESEARYRILFDQSKDAVMTLEPPDWKFTSANPSIADMFSAEDADGFTSLHPWSVSPDDQPDGQLSSEKAKAMIETAMREGFHHFEWTHRRLDGTDFPAMVTLSRMQMGGRTFLHAVVRDISQQKEAEAALKQAHAELEQRVRERTDELSQANARLRNKERRLKHLLRASDHERQLIAYDIHDGLAQDLAAAIMQFEIFGHQRETQPEDARKTFAGGMALLRQGHREARRLISGVRPPILDESGVLAAIAHLVHDPAFDHGAKVDFRSRVTFHRLDPVAENVIYRIVQEGLSNARTHSQSDRIVVSIVQRRDRLRIVVRDWGVGFDPEDVPENRFGLAGIRERARLLGGKCQVRSAPGEGAAVVVDLPVVQPQEDPA